MRLLHTISLLSAALLVRSQSTTTVSDVSVTSTSTISSTSDVASTSTAAITPSNPSGSATTSTSSRTTTTARPTATSSSSAYDPSSPPDVLLNVPQLSVGRIELNVDNLEANINLNAKVASLVSINAGVAVSVQNINLTIADVDVQLELIVRLGHLVDIVNRVFESVDLNPLILGVANATESLVGGVVGAVDGLLGTITRGGTTLSFLVDNLGNIVQSVAGGAGGGGGAVETIVGNFRNNMTATGASQALGNGLTKQTYSYGPLNALVDIITNTAGQVVQATVQKTKAPLSSVTSVVGSVTSAVPINSVTSVVGTVTSAVLSNALPTETATTSS